MKLANHLNHVKCGKSASLIVGFSMALFAIGAQGATRLADGFSSPIGGIPGAQTVALDSIDNWHVVTDHAANGTGDNALLLHAGEDWFLNDGGTVEDATGQTVVAVANGEVIVVSADAQGDFVVIRHAVPEGLVAGATPSQLLSRADEIYSVYRNLDADLPLTNAQGGDDPINVLQDDTIGTVNGGSGDTIHLHFEMRLTGTLCIWHLS